MVNEYFVLYKLPGRWKTVFGFLATVNFQKREEYYYEQDKIYDSMYNGSIFCIWHERFGDAV